ncbi:hypothetical protein [Listeria newyorkensis]|uniref:hypothetical protein n=1 Tax=Listeria newyorkensis TaxID=1497681 RepID=UPI0005665669|nr:hypothetical protein [Listeria newyorkensis]SQC56814.1 Uncharacterised protein [Listeria newyorkensis]
MLIIEVKDVVCDYGVYVDGVLSEHLIFNKRSNAEAVAEIMRNDSLHGMESLLNNAWRRNEIEKERTKNPKLITDAGDKLFYGTMYGEDEEAIQFHIAPWTYEQVLQLEGIIEDMQKELSVLKNQDKNGGK